MTTITLQPGQQVRFSRPWSDHRSWWTVRAVSADGRWAVLTRQAPFKPRGEIVYTIIDWERAVRGPCNLIGQGWDFDGMSQEGLRKSAEALIEALEAHRAAEGWWLDKPAGASRPITETEVEVSYRNHVPIEISAVRDVVTS